MKLVMTLLVRDEEDIIVANLEHHLHGGVDFVYVTDNLSTDATRDLIAPYERGRVVTVIEERSDNYSQAVWVTRMARQAHSEGADWVINSDADEFWWPTGQESLRRFFESLDRGVGAVIAQRHDFPPIEPSGASPFWERMLYKKANSLNSLGRPLPPKVAHRASPGVEVAQGNHSVKGLDPELSEMESGLEILHFPIRSEQQFIRKIVNGGAAYERNSELDDQVGSTWRSLYAEYKARGLGDRYRAEAVREEEVADLVRRGLLLRDDRLGDRMRSTTGLR